MPPSGYPEPCASQASPWIPPPKYGMHHQAQGSRGVDRAWTCAHPEPLSCGTELGRERRGQGFSSPPSPCSSAEPKESWDPRLKPGLPGCHKGIFVKVEGQNIVSSLIFHFAGIHLHSCSGPTIGTGLNISTKGDSVSHVAAGACFSLRLFTVCPLSSVFAFGLLVFICLFFFEFIYLI